MTLEFSGSTLFKIYEYDLRGFKLLIDVGSNVGSCSSSLTIASYKEFVRKVVEAQESLESITDEWRKKAIRRISPMIPDLDMCYFFPAGWWDAQDVLDWFTLIDFTPVSPAADFSNKLTAHLILQSNALDLFTEDDWTLLREKYSAYCKKLKAHWPELKVKKLRKIHKKTELY